MKALLRYYSSILTVGFLASLNVLVGSIQKNRDVFQSISYPFSDDFYIKKSLLPEIDIAFLNRVNIHFDKDALSKKNHQPFRLIYAMRSHFNFLTNPVTSV